MLQMNNLLNRPVSKETDSLTKTSLQRKPQDKLVSLMNQTLLKIWRDRTLQNSSYEASITITPKSDKDKQQKKKTTTDQYPRWIDGKILKKYQQTEFNTHWKYYTPWPSRNSAWDERMVQHMQINKCDTHLTEWKIKIKWSSQ